MSRSHSEFVVPLLRSLRAEIMTAYGQVEHDVKEDLTVVTAIDKRVERKIIDALSVEFPDIGFLGEEHGQSGPSDIYWVIDPIDGTESYVRGLPGVTSMLGLVEDGVATQSYIYDPVSDVMYSAYKGSGAYADDEQIEVVNRPVGRSILAVSSAVPKYEPQLMQKLYDAGVFYIGQYFGSGLKAIYLASGKIDGVITFNKPGKGGGPWDYIPTRLLAEEAGANTTSYDGEKLDSRFYTALSDNLQVPVSEVMKGYFG